MAHDPRISELRHLEPREGGEQERQASCRKGREAAQGRLAGQKGRFKDHGAGLAEIVTYLLSAAAILFFLNWAADSFHKFQGWVK